MVTDRGKILGDYEQLKPYREDLDERSHSIQNIYRVNYDNLEASTSNQKDCTTGQTSILIVDSETPLPESTIDPTANEISELRRKLAAQRELIAIEQLKLIDKLDRKRIAGNNKWKVNLGLSTLSADRSFVKKPFSVAKQII